MAIFDAMQLCTAPISTVVFGLAASTAALIAAGGSKGMRFAMPNARIMMHQPLGGASGQAIDVEIQAKEIMYHKTNIVRIMSEISGRTPQQVCDCGGKRQRPCSLVFSCCASCDPVCDEWSVPPTRWFPHASARAWED